MPSDTRNLNTITPKEIPISTHFQDDLWHSPYALYSLCFYATIITSPIFIIMGILYVYQMNTPIFFLYFIIFIVIILLIMAFIFYHPLMKFSKYILRRIYYNTPIEKMNLSIEKKFEEEKIKFIKAVNIKFRRYINFDIYYNASESGLEIGMFQDKFNKNTIVLILRYNNFANAPLIERFKSSLTRDLS